VRDPDVTVKPLRAKGLLAKIVAFPAVDGQKTLNPQRFTVTATRPTSKNDELDKRTWIKGLSHEKTHKW
jgi:hypothetical protein